MASTWTELALLLIRAAEVALLLLLVIAVVNWWRRSGRFSLRAMLLAMTLVAVVLGMLMWAGK